MKRIKLYAAALCLLMGVGAVAMTPSVALAASPQSTVCSTLGDGSNCSGTPSNGINLNTTVRAIVSIFSAVVGVVSVIMIIIGGFRFVIANGDSSRITSARMTILYAIVGLVVVAMAQLIVKFALSRST